MPPLAHPPACPAGIEVCPVFAEFLRLQEECRRLRELSHTDLLTGLYSREVSIPQLTTTFFAIFQLPYIKRKYLS
jgi:GGDEF domain-containing protein